MSNQYEADGIQVLRGLEPVKARPGMYTRTDAPTHILQEVLDNAADEALAGFAKNISVTIYADGSAEVSDDGRGIPIEVPKGEAVPAVELVFTQLHSGGKFSKNDESSAYRFSGGLHGVGVSVTNALSTRLEVEVHRDGKKYTLAFSAGDVIEPLKQSGTCLKRETGTRVRCWPDPKYFDSPKINLKEIEHLVKSKAVLMPGVAMKLFIEVNGELVEKSWVYESGISQYLAEAIAAELNEVEDEFRIPIVSGGFFHEETAEVFSKGEGAEMAIAFMPGGGGSGESYVNLIPTIHGGTHDAGLRQGLFDAIRTFMEHHNLMQKGVKVAPEDVWSNLKFVLSAKILDPQFQGQTKEKLTSRDAMKLVSSAVKYVVEPWLNSNTDQGKRIAELVNRSASARSKSAQKIEKRKSSGINMMPAKLTDCEAAGTMAAEIFLVEGDSAGGSAKMARNKEYQSILPLRGKVLNTWEIDAGQILGNNEVHDIFVALGINPHTEGTVDSIKNLRYGRVCILSDADVDGSHIQTLLLALFMKHAPDLVLSGHVYISKPPLYRIDVPSHGKNKPARKIYISDDEEKFSMIDRLKREGLSEDKLTIQRFKGLGEMNPDQLWETTLCPDTRRLSQVRVDNDPTTMFTMLMSKNESSARREWMERRGNDIEADV